MGGKVGKSVYALDLHLIDTNPATSAEIFRVVSFSCTPEELEDLRSRVKEAVRVAAALVSSK
jgi:hypothetical protein